MAEIKNPGLTINVPTPEEGEVFLLDGSTLGIRKGNQIITARDPGGLGFNLDSYQKDFVSNAGLDYNNLRSFNAGDLFTSDSGLSESNLISRGDIPSNLLGSADQRLKDLVSSKFQSLYQDNPNLFIGSGSSESTTTEFDQNAINNSLNPNSPENIAARDAAAKNAGFASGQDAINVQKQIQQESNSSNTFQTALAGGQSPASTPSQSNPFLGIPAEISSQFTSVEQAQAYQNAISSGVSPQEAARLAVSSGGQPNVGEYVSNPEYLKYYTEDEIIRNSDGSIYLRPNTDVRWGSSDIKKAVDEKTEDVKFDIAATLDGETFKESQSDPTGFGDLSSLFTELKNLRTDLINSLKPTAEEKDLKQQLVDLKKGYNDEFNRIEDNPNLTTRLAIGQQDKLLRQAQATEANLINRLELAQEDRAIATKAAELGLDFALSNIDLRFKIADAIEKKNTNAFNQAQALSSSAKQSLGLILDQFAGVRVSDLSAGDQAKLAQLAAQAGIPFDLVSQGMDATASQLEFNNILKASQLNGDTLAGLTDQQIGILQNIQTQVRQDADIKGFVEVRQAYNRVLASTKDPSPAGDLALIFNYMKMLDPGSTVREGEFANAENSAGVPERIKAQYNKVRNGKRLSNEQRQDFVNQAEGLYDSQLGSYQDAVDFYSNQATTFGIPTELILRDYTNTIGGSDSLPPLSQSYASLDQLVSENPNYYDVVAQILFDNPQYTDSDILRALTFSDDLSTSQNYLKQYGQITGFGSPVWDKGLDVDLKIGDPVTSPVSGKVIKAGVNGGFGNQVQIEDSSGNIVMLSHLSGFNVRPGDRIFAGQQVGKGGNSGTVIPGAGGDGSHLDITIKKPDGSYYSATEVYKLLA